jgi:CHASE3 domain sensor protein
MPSAATRFGPLRRRFAAFLALLPLSMAPTAWGAFRLQGPSGLMMHTHQVFESLSTIRAALRQATSSFDGFVTTGEEPLAAQYRTAMAGAWQEVWRFKELTADNPHQVAGTTLLESSIAELARARAKVISGGADPATAKEAAIAERIMSALRTLTAEERHLFGRRAAKMETALRALLWRAGLTLALLAAQALWLWAEVERALHGAAGKGSA